MEPTAAWAPCEFQLANWSIEEPAAYLPVEYASIDIPGTCLEACVPEYYYYYAASQQHNVTSDQKAKISNDSDAQSVVDQVMGEFKADIDMMKAKMHRYPACLGDVDESYTLPRIVAIGPYHHGKEHLKQAEKVKHAAACHCVRQSGRSLEELYGAVVPMADHARHFYDKDVMAGINPEDFRHMMFFDACFLVQYMLSRAYTGDVDQSLNGFLSPNRIDIFHDVMLLENQLPWHVVETVIRLLRLPSLSKKFVARKRNCMLSDDRHEPPQQKPFIWYDSYKPPHLLGLLRYYIVGRSDIEYPKQEKKDKSYSLSAMELAKIGITLTANKTMQLIDMTLNQKGTLFAELSLAPLSLDRDRASFLVNMAALELCTVQSFSAARDGDSAVCSYLLLLAKLVYREEDVQELRVRGLLQGGGGLTNEEALRFFTSFQGLRFGPYYYRIMVQIQIYRESSRMKTKSFAFFHNHKKTIAAVVSGVVSVGGIIGTLLSIKKTL
ncbi:hypothetical protein SEVIR_8G247600v4 [Setaria viridis]|uniref:Uncharacterized protein n=2 Tax=Setaria viridis TaxID=4556 RepID=A0A4V6D3F8_SETVI|nr:UPF0481 protein At3g47200-like isoform X2 [Setaria viridis]TKW02526.1 hypothetical protein SEVIR_8G247600v2 [Setaria viridis]